MAKLVYKGKVNGNDVFYKEGCINYHLEGGYRMNLMEVVTETGKEFRFRACHIPYSILDCLEENRSYINDDSVDEVVIKEKGKGTLKYNSKNAKDRTVEGKRTKMFIEKANKMYNETRRGVLRDLIEKPKDKKLESLLVTDQQIKEEVEDAFNTDPKIYGLSLYRDDTKRFIKFFSKIDKDRKKGLLNEIFSCDYENKEVIDWLNKNEQDLLREAGFNS
jgi:hypothetical protein